MPFPEFNDSLACVKAVRYTYPGGKYHKTDANDRIEEAFYAGAKWAWEQVAFEVEHYDEIHGDESLEVAK